MPNLTTLLHHRPFYAKLAVYFILILMLVAFAAKVFFPNTLTVAAANRELTFADRVTAQRVIEEVYWRHQIWPKENPQPKPSFNSLVSDAVIEEKVRDYLQKSEALESYWGQPITAQQLQAEMERQANHSHLPAVLRELWAALNNDPLLIAECLVRPTLAEQQLRAQVSEVEYEEWWRGRKDEFKKTSLVTDIKYQLPEIIMQASGCFNESWRSTTLVGAPSPRRWHTAIWTGNEMIIWGGRGPAPLLDLNTGGRYNPATDTWMATTTLSAPTWRQYHTAIWTGTEMIVWGGVFGQSSQEIWFKTGGRYNPVTNSWMPVSTTGAPDERGLHTAVWTGEKMIIWGGWGMGQLYGPLASGGSYSPTTDKWQPTSTTNAPDERFRHTSIWTGSEMIIWDGLSLVKGARYNPVTNAWIRISDFGDSFDRNEHSSVWTGTEMIIWGGSSGGNTDLNTGGRYRPITNTWSQTSVTNSPSPRYFHTSIWTGSEMIVWGGIGRNIDRTGGRYQPNADRWTATTTLNSPAPRFHHSAVWTGDSMIVWGGALFNDGGPTNTGSIYALVSTLKIAPESKSFSAGAEKGTVNVTSSAGCTWKAETNDDWIHLFGNTSGTGNGTVNFELDSNNDNSERTGTLKIESRTLTITQAAGNALPILTSLSPDVIPAGTAGFTLVAKGADFVDGAKVRWDGKDRQTTFVTSAELKAIITAEDLKSVGTVRITVLNPSPGGGESSELSFNITPGLASVSAASFANSQLAPESIVACFGTGLAKGFAIADRLPLPVELAGTRVRVKDSQDREWNAGLFFVSPLQINYLMPAGVAPGLALVKAISGDGSLSSGLINIEPTAPSLFSANANGQGVAAAVVLRIRNGRQTFEPVAQFDPLQNRLVAIPINLGPESDQVILVLFGTGLRWWPTSSPPGATAQIGGLAAELLFVGPSPDFVGLDQCNMRLSRSLIGRGPVGIQVAVNGRLANQVFVEVR